ncbi:UNVERIFIED_ORG: Na+/H+ antiporter NhaC [Bacillus proteolyticus]
MNRNLKTSTIIAIEVGIAIYDHNLSLDTIYFAAILICIVLLFGTRVSEEKASTSKQRRRKTALIFWPSILLSIVSFAVISYITIGYVSVPGIIGFSCFVTYGGFVFISIIKRKSKN